MLVLSTQIDSSKRKNHLKNLFAMVLQLRYHPIYVYFPPVCKRFNIATPGPLNHKKYFLGSS